MPAENLFRLENKRPTFIIVKHENIDIVDAWILAYSSAKGITGIYSFDKDLSRLGLKLLKVEGSA
jgi:predicted nucleic acid-binding protein